MPAPAGVVALSQFDIENKILDYFVRRFHRPPTEITRNTDIKQHFNFTAGNWPSVAAALSAEQWMIALGVELEQSEMPEHTTAKALAQLIWAKVTKLVAVHGASSLDLFSSAIVQPAAKRSAKPAARKKRAGKRP